jgi:hypothetical protein
VPGGVIVLIFVLTALVAAIAAVATWAVYVAARRVKLGKTAYATIEKFIESFSTDSGLKGERVGSSILGRITDARFTGEISGRRARVAFENQGQNNWTGERYDYARISVAAPETPQFTVALEGLASKLGKAIGIKRPLELGDRDFDDRFVVDSLEPARAKRVLEKQATREAIQSAFAHYGVERLECVRGDVAAVVPIGQLAPGDYRSLIETVGRVASLLDAQSIRVAGTDAVSEAARCGYCHEAASADADDLLACEVCHTVTHKSCRAELGRCPVAGCGGSAPEHVKVRAR